MSAVSKILKLELLALFLITVISVYSFYYQGMMADNYLGISSSNESLTFIPYYIFSFTAFIGFFVGPWILTCFFVYVFFYTIKFSKRDSIYDVLNTLNLMISCLFLTAYFSPILLGEGLRYFLSSNMPSFLLLPIGLLSGVCFLLGSVRNSLAENLSQTYSGIVFSAKYIFQKLKKGVLFFWNFNLSRVLKRKKTNIQTKLPTILQGNDHKIENEQNELQPTIKEKVNSGLNAINPLKSKKKKKEKREEEKRESLEEKSTPQQQELRDRNKKNFDEQYHSLVSSKVLAAKTVQDHGPDEQYFSDIIQRIEGKLAEFRIEGSIINILKGPVVDTFELELGTGVKVSKVLNAEKDLSIALLGAPIRIVYPMIGRHTMGIEVPRNPREFILLEEVLSSDEFKKNQFKIPIAMGKDAFGETFVVDLASMPHMLVAGATGAGKSVFINTLLVSILVKMSPSQLKLILIDPKQLELALYSKLPHLIMPVITDPKRSSIALLWACEEMERRYSILKELGVRNIEGFNEKLKRATPEMLAAIHPYYKNEPNEKYELPYLVIIVDEFADLILTKAGKEIESNICRLAAKARAAGIHLVLATQRPSVDVITGLIKSNFPTRVAFRVTSPVDSRTILTTTGAEKLLGKGDMLYRNGTDNKRVHASYVGEDEIEVLTEKLASLPRGFHESAMEFLENGGDQQISDDPYRVGSHIPTVGEVTTSGNDEQLFHKAVQTVIEHKTASASMLQRRLRIGYNRAANLIEEMEARGIVGPAEGSKRRKVLLSSTSEL